MIVRNPGNTKDNSAYNRASTKWDARQKMAPRFNFNQPLPFNGLTPSPQMEPCISSNSHETEPSNLIPERGMLSSAADTSERLLAAASVHQHDGRWWSASYFDSRTATQVTSSSQNQHGVTHHFHDDDDDDAWSDNVESRFPSEDDPHCCLANPCEELDSNAMLQSQGISKTDPDKKNTELDKNIRNFDAEKTTDPSTNGFEDDSTCILPPIVAHPSISVVVTQRSLDLSSVHKSEETASFKSPAVVQESRPSSSHVAGSAIMGDDSSEKDPHGARGTGVSSKNVQDIPSVGVIVELGSVSSNKVNHASEQEHFVFSLPGATPVAPPDVRKRMVKVFAELEMSVPNQLQALMRWTSALKWSGAQDIGAFNMSGSISNSGGTRTVGERHPPTTNNPHSLAMAVEIPKLASMKLLKILTLVEKASRLIQTRENKLHVWNRMGQPSQAPKTQHPPTAVLDVRYKRALREVDIASRQCLDCLSELRHDYGEDLLFRDSPYLKKMQTDFERTSAKMEDITVLH
jgi:hypothetical protein